MMVDVPWLLAMRDFKPFKKTDTHNVMDDKFPDTPNRLKVLWIDCNSKKITWLFGFVFLCKTVDSILITLECKDKNKIYT